MRYRVVLTVDVAAANPVDAAQVAVAILAKRTIQDGTHQTVRVREVDPKTRKPVPKTKRKKAAA